MKLRYPNFLGIGVQKAGTTWLHQHLQRHPDVWLPPLKELHYFDAIHIPGSRKWAAALRRTQGMQALCQHIDWVPRDKWNYRLISCAADIIDGQISDEWYGSILARAKPDQICGEVTPGYCILPTEGIQHILRLAPDVKIILSLRDPIERSWSQIRQILRSAPGGGETDLRRIASSSDVTTRADYPTIISRWSQLVPQQRLFVLFMDDIVAQPSKLMADLCAFLGITFRADMFAELDKPAHVGEKLDMPAEIYDFLKEQLRPIYDETAKLFPDIARGWIERHY